MPSIRRCFICDYKYDPKNVHIMMHSFPVCKDVRKQWIIVCGILSTDDVKNLSVCSKHFQPEDYYKPHASSVKYRLKKSAIPSRSVVNTVSTRGSFDLSPDGCNEKVKDEEVHAVEETSETTICSPSTSFIENIHTRIDGQSTPEKSRFMEPRYINEISPTHIKTTRRAKTVIDMVKQKYKIQAVKMKKLQDNNRSLHKKIQSLEDMIAHLKQKNLLSEHAGDQMLQLLPDSSQEIMKKQLNGNMKYSNKLRFTLTLHFYSPRAYLYVCSAWKNILLHPSTIKQ